jgi:hypothetical protein
VFLRLALLTALLAPTPALACHLLDRPGARVLTPADLREKPVAFPFAPGERLEWGVRYFGIEVGRAAVEVVRFVEVHGRRVAHVVGTARTNAIFSVFYRVDDRTEAWIDADALLTLRTATHTRHGRRREIYEEVEFDWPTRFVKVFEARRHSADAQRLELDFGPFAHDTFDALYTLRGMPLKTGDRVRLPVYATQKIYEFEIAVGERSAIRSPVLGRVEALAARPLSRLDGEAQGDGRGRVWITDDERHIPVRANGWLRSTQGLRIGGLRAELVDYRAGEPGWPAPRSATRPASPPMPPTVEGWPQWQPPPEIREVRRRRETEVVIRRFAFTWPAAGIGCPESEVAPGGMPGAQSSKSPR